MSPVAQNEAPPPATQPAGAPVRYIAMPLRGRDGLQGYTKLDGNDFTQFYGPNYFLHAKSKYSQGYAARKVKVDGAWEMRFLHREVLGLDRDDPRSADHINGDTLDNRRSNLRAVTHLENMQNMKAHRDSMYSEHRGVTFSKRKGKWMARVRQNETDFFLGYHDSEDAAARAVDQFINSRACETTTKTEG